MACLLIYSFIIFVWILLAYLLFLSFIFFALHPIPDSRVGDGQPVHVAALRVEHEQLQRGRPEVRNMFGDSDSVAAVCGQIAGAFSLIYLRFLFLNLRRVVPLSRSGSFYGFESIPAEWITKVLAWDPYGLIPYRAKLLYENGYQCQPSTNTSASTNTNECEMNVETKS
jgi:hypothetical protein